MPERPLTKRPLTEHPLTASVRGPGAERLGEDRLASLDLAAGRRAFLRGVGLGSVWLGLAGAGLAPRPARAQPVGDAALFNFALNLEYLEAEFYLRAARGAGLPDDLVAGTGAPGAVTGGRQVAFQDRVVRNYANEIAGDELAHVRLLRSALGRDAAARPAIDLAESFTAAARAAGLVTAQQTFDPFADDVGFLLGAFLFEDVGVTAYAGLLPMVSDRNNVAAASAILAVEGYHAGAVRSLLYGRGLYDPVQRLSDLRAALGTSDQGIGSADVANIVPTDGNALVARRTPPQVLAVLYGNPEARPGRFFPKGLNGDFR